MASDHLDPLPHAQDSQPGPLLPSQHVIHVKSMPIVGNAQSN